MTLRLDAHRRIGPCGPLAVCRLLLTDRAFRPLVTHRLSATVRGRWYGFIVSPFLYIAHRLFCQMAVMDMPLRTRIGEAVAINHGWGLVLSHGAVIGRNVTLFQGVTIGQGDRISSDGVRETGYPIIEDEVWLGPHSTVVGAVRVGRGSRILANTVVIRDVPPYSIVSGVPGVVIRSNCESDVHNEFNFSDVHE